MWTFQLLLLFFVLKLLIAPKEIETVKIMAKFRHVFTALVTSSRAADACHKKSSKHFPDFELYSDSRPAPLAWGVIPAVGRVLFG